MELRAALVQLTASDDPGSNLPVTEALVRQAAAGGAELVLTPEVSNCVSTSRARQAAVLEPEATDPTLARLRAVAAECRLWLLIGSLALKGGAEGRLVNRSLLVGPDGAIAARYDKIHMFDVEIGGTEAYRESAGFAPGGQAVVAPTPWGGLGMAVCYDMRFAPLALALARGGAAVLAYPSAFTVPTGRAHWEVLLRARAIETGCFVLALAQCGTHPATEGRARQTWGHSLAVGPWGEVLADGGEAPGVTHVRLDLAEVERARARIPALANARSFADP